MAALVPLLTGLAFPESPRWHEDRLWLADWGAHEIVAVDMDGKSEIVTEVASFPFSIDWLPDGRLLAVSARHRSVLRMGTDGSMVTHVDLSGISERPWNEIVVDGRGNIYLNNIGFDFPGGDFAPGIIALVAPDGSVRPVADELAFPNGMAVTADNSTLILAESVWEHPHGLLYSFRRHFVQEACVGQPRRRSTRRHLRGRRRVRLVRRCPQPTVCPSTRGRRSFTNGHSRPRMLCLHAGRARGSDTFHRGQPMGRGCDHRHDQPRPRRSGGSNRRRRTGGRLALIGHGIGPIVRSIPFGVGTLRRAQMERERASRWARWGSNPRPRDYESPALTAELRALVWSDLLLCLELPQA